MDGTRLASEYQAEAHLASRESPQDESSCLDSYHGGDVGRRERASKRGTDCSKKVGITQRVGEVGMAVGPPERSKGSCLTPGLSFTGGLSQTQSSPPGVLPHRARQHCGRIAVSHASSKLVSRCCWLITEVDGWS